MTRRRCDGAPPLLHAIVMAATLVAAGGPSFAGPIPAEHDRAELEARIAGRTRMRVTLSSRQVIPVGSLLVEEGGLLFHAAADTAERLVPWPEIAAIEAAYPMRLQSAFIGALAEDWSYWSVRRAATNAGSRS